MAEIVVYRATVRTSSTFQGEVYDFDPFTDCQYGRFVPPDELVVGLMPEALLLRDNTEIRLTVPDELFEEKGPGGRPRVRASAGSDADHYTAWGLIRQVRAGVPGFSVVRPSGVV